MSVTRVTCLVGPMSRTPNDIFPAPSNGMTAKITRVATALNLMAAAPSSASPISLGRPVLRGRCPSEPSGERTSDTMNFGPPFPRKAMSLSRTSPTSLSATTGIIVSAVATDPMNGVR